MVSSFVAFGFGSLLAARGVTAAVNPLTELIGITPNPNGVGLYSYIPPVVKSDALIVAIHYCTGTANAYFTGTQYANLADTYGFRVIYPEARRETRCFDVASNATLTHDGGGDSQGIASAIKYAIKTWGVNPRKVYVTGTSSGAMTTQVMSGSYPDLITATSEYNGVPFACFAGPTEWNSDCSTGSINRTAQEWGDIVRAAYPGYHGPRPRMMLWHGGQDTGLHFNNWFEAVKQWTNVLGIPSTDPVLRSNDNPEAGYVMTFYGSTTKPKVVGYYAEAIGHTVPVHEAIELEWFCITPGPLCPEPPVMTSTTTRWPPTDTSSTITRTTTMSMPTPPSCVQPKWWQCGGRAFTGCTKCEAGTTCVVLNEWFSQCL